MCNKGCPFTGVAIIRYRVSHYWCNNIQIQVSHYWCNKKSDTGCPITCVKIIRYRCPITGVLIIRYWVSHYWCNNNQIQVSHYWCNKKSDTVVVIFINTMKTNFWFDFYFYQAFKQQKHFNIYLKKKLSIITIVN